MSCRKRTRMSADSFINPIFCQTCAADKSKILLVPGRLCNTSLTELVHFSLKSSCLKLIHKDSSGQSFTRLLINKRQKYILQATSQEETDLKDAGAGEGLFVGRRWPAAETRVWGRWMGVVTCACPAPACHGARVIASLALLAYPAHI